MAYRDGSVKLKESTSNIESDIYFDQGGLRKYSDVIDIFDSIDVTNIIENLEPDYYQWKAWGGHGSYATNPPQKTLIIDDEFVVNEITENQLPIDGYGIGLKLLSNPRENTERIIDDKTVELSDEYLEEKDYILIYEGI